MAKVRGHFDGQIWWFEFLTQSGPNFWLWSESMSYDSGNDDDDDYDDDDYDDDDDDDDDNDDAKKVKKKKKKN